MYIYCFRKFAIELVWLLRKRFFLSIAQFTLGAHIQRMILREDSSSQFMGRQKRALIPFFYNNYLHCNTLYFKIGISLSIITEVALLQSFFCNIFPFFTWDSLSCFNVSRSTSWFLDLACYFIIKVTVFSLAFFSRLQIFRISRLLPE